LHDLGVAEETRRTLLAGIPRTIAVGPEQAERFWSERKRWFFKPPRRLWQSRGVSWRQADARVFEEILHGGYIAQEIALPSEHVVTVATGEAAHEGGHPLPTFTTGASSWCPPASTRARRPISARRAAASRRYSSPER
jgi:hypothetical protein